MCFPASDPPHPRMLQHMVWAVLEPKRVPTASGETPQQMSERMPSSARSRLKVPVRVRAVYASRRGLVPPIQLQGIRLHLNAVSPGGEIHSGMSRCSSPHPTSSPPVFPQRALPGLQTPEARDYPPPPPPAPWCLPLYTHSVRSGNQSENTEEEDTEDRMDRMDIPLCILELGPQTLCPKTSSGTGKTLPVLRPRQFPKGPPESAGFQSAETNPPQIAPAGGPKRLEGTMGERGVPHPRGLCTPNHGALGLADRFFGCSGPTVSAIDLGLCIRLHPRPWNLN